MVRACECFGCLRPLIVPRCRVSGPVSASAHAIGLIRTPPATMDCPKARASESLCSSLGGLPVTRWPRARRPSSRRRRCRLLRRPVPTCATSGCGKQLPGTPNLLQWAADSVDSLPHGSLRSVRFCCKQNTLLPLPRFFRGRHLARANRGSRSGHHQPRSRDDGCLPSTHKRGRAHPSCS
jgi:hypothetical protein